MKHKDQKKEMARRKVIRNTRRAQYFKEHPCKECGATTRLELHHREPELKVTHNIWEWGKLRREIELAKCDVLCHYCHIAAPKFKHGQRYYTSLGCPCDLCKAERKRRRESKN